MMGGDARITRTVLSLWIPGRPRTKGSLKPQIVRDGKGRPTGRVRMVEQVEDSPRWRRTIAHAVLALRGTEDDGSFLTEQAVSVDLMFCVARTGQEHAFPVAKTFGDVDKYTRNALDAFTDARVYPDDRLVVDVLARKRFVPSPQYEGMFAYVWEVVPVADVPIGVPC